MASASGKASAGAALGGLQASASGKANPSTALLFLESVIEGDRRAKNALHTLALSGDELAAEALFRAGVSFRTAQADSAESKECFALAASGDVHCAALYTCGILEEEGGNFKGAFALYTRAAAAGEASLAAAAPAAAPPAGGAAAAAFQAALESTRLEALADATFRLGDLVDEGPTDGPLPIDLGAARAHFARAAALFECAGLRGRVAEASARLAYTILHACPGDGRSLLGLDWPGLRPAIERSFAHGVVNPFLAALMARAFAEGVEGVTANPTQALVWAERALSPTACDPSHTTVQKDALISIAALIQLFLPGGTWGQGKKAAPPSGALLFDLRPPPSASGSASGGSAASVSSSVSKPNPLRPAHVTLLQGILGALRGLAESPAWAPSNVASFALWQTHRIHKVLAMRATDEDDRAMQHGADLAVLEALAGQTKECSGCAAASLYVAYRDGGLGVKPNARLKLKWQVRVLELQHDLPEPGQGHGCDT